MPRKPKDQFEEYAEEYGEDELDDLMDLLMEFPELDDIDNLLEAMDDENYWTE